MPIKTAPINIGIVDDHQLFREGLASYISAITDDIQVTLQAMNGLDLHNRLMKMEEDDIPKLLLLDISMPQMDGYETMKSLKESYPTVKVMVLSMHDSEKVILKMLKLGAHSFVSKNISIEDLIDSIKQTLTKKYHYPPHINDALIDYFKSGDEDLIPKDQVTGLQFTERETEILKCLCTELTANEIADKLLVSKRTVEYHINSLLTKVGAKSRTGLVLYAIRSGKMEE